MIIWLASYPRSGNTLLRIVLNQVFGVKTYSRYNDRLDIAKDANTAQIVGHKNWAEEFSLENARASDEIYFTKTHEQFESDSDKAIYVIRDGRESVVSYFHYLKDFLAQEIEISDVVLGKVNFGGWNDHVLSWNPLIRPNTLLLRFQDLTSQPDECIRQIEEFIGIQPRKVDVPSFSELQDINPKFFRSGQSDSWNADLNGTDLFAFWLLSYGQMANYFPNVMPPWADKKSNHSPSREFEEVYGEKLSSYLLDKGNTISELTKNARTQKVKLNQLGAKYSEVKQCCERMTAEKLISSPLKKLRAYKDLVAKISSNNSGT